MEATLKSLNEEEWLRCNWDMPPSEAYQRTDGAPPCLVCHGPTPLGELPRLARPSFRLYQFCSLACEAVARLRRG